jgi:filamentous hemagglutinin
MVSGTTTLLTGRPTATLGGKLVSNIMGVSPATGELLNSLVGLSPVAVDAALINGVIKMPVSVAKNGAVVTDGATLEKTLNNFYRDGAPPTLIQQTFNQAALSSTYNAGASEVVLGRYISGSSSSYEAVAKARGATYFSMSDWSAVEGQLGADKMWNINKAFLDQQIAQGKRFLFTADPALAPPGSFTSLEYQHLLNSGYKIQPTTGGYFNAVKH